MPKTPVRLIALSAATGGLFGYMIAVSNDAIASVRTELQLTPLAAALVVSALVAGALLGCVVAGTAADRIGRRYTLIAAAVVALVGVALTSAAGEPVLMTSGRVVTGISVGITSAVAPLYLAELAPFARRGTVLTTYQLFITVGILTAFATGLLLAPSGQWRWMFALGGVTAVAQLVAALLVPPSPRFLVRRGQVDQARASLARLRPPDEVEPELDAIVSAAAEEEDTPPLRELFSARFRPGVVVGLMMALMNALVGVGAVIYYSTDVFRAAGIGGTNGAEFASLAVGGVNFLAAVVSVFLTDRFGRRPLLSIGLVGIAVCLAVAGRHPRRSGRRAGRPPGRRDPRLHRVLRDLRRAAGVAAPVRGAAGQHPRPRRGDRHRRQLGGEPADHAAVPPGRRQPRRPGTRRDGLLVLRHPDPGLPGLRPAARPRDEGPDARTHRGRSPRHPVTR